MCARIHDIEGVEFQVVHGNAHGWGDCRDVGALEFDTHSLPALDHQQIVHLPDWRGPLSTAARERPKAVLTESSRLARFNMGGS